MASEDALDNFSALMGRVKHAVEQKETGTFFILANQKSSATISINQGNIIQITYSKVRNEHAIPYLKKISSCSAKFSRGFVIKLDNQGTTLRQDDVQQLLSLGRETASQPANDTSDGGAGAQKELSSEAKDLLEQALIDYVGPFASIVCQEVFSSVSSPQSAIEMLAAVIPDHDESRSFMDQASKKLGG